MSDSFDALRRANPRAKPGFADSVEAALNVSVHASRTSLEELESRFLPLLLDTTRAIEQDLRAGSR